MIVTQEARLLSPAPVRRQQPKIRSYEPHDDRRGAQPASSPSPHPAATRPGHPSTRGGEWRQNVAERRAASRGMLRREAGVQWRHVSAISSCDVNDDDDDEDCRLRSYLWLSSPCTCMAHVWPMVCTYVVALWAFALWLQKGALPSHSSRIRIN